jgi:hypothetical protein
LFVHLLCVYSVAQSLKINVLAISRQLEKQLKILLIKNKKSFMASKNFMPFQKKPSGLLKTRIKKLA